MTWKDLTLEIVLYTSKYFANQTYKTLQKDNTSEFYLAILEFIQACHSYNTCRASQNSKDKSTFYCILWRARKSCTVLCQSRKIDLRNLFF